MKADAWTLAEQPPAAWPDAMSAVAEAFTVGLADVPPEKQWGEMARIMALTTAAAVSRPGVAPPQVAAMAGG